jgi:hypothetical protein
MPDCVAFTDASSLPEAAPYFAVFRNEPISADGSYLGISSVVPITGITVVKLLLAMAKQTGLKTAVIACHSSTEGLSVPLIAPFTKNFLDSEAISALVSRPAISSVDEKVAVRLNIEAKDLKVLRGAIEAVKKLALARIAIRGCDIGSNARMLGMIKALLGCASICAPTRPTFFGSVDLPSRPASARDWTDFIVAHPIEKQRRIEGDFAWAYTQPGQYRIKIEAISRSSPAAVSWVRKHIGPSRYQGGPFPYELIRAADHLAFPRDPDFQPYLAVQ